MTTSLDTASEREFRRLMRNKAAALLERDSTINRLKAISDLSTCLQSELDLIPSFLISVEELDNL